MSLCGLLVKVCVQTTSTNEMLLWSIIQLVLHVYWDHRHAMYYSIIEHGKRLEVGLCIERCASLMMSSLDHIILYEVLAIVVHFLHPALSRDRSPSLGRFLPTRPVCVETGLHHG